MKKLNLRELEVFESHFKRFASYARIDEIEQLKVRAAIITERKKIQQSIIRHNPTFDFYRPEDES